MMVLLVLVIRDVACFCCLPQEPSAAIVIAMFALFTAVNGYQAGSLSGFRTARPAVSVSMAAEEHAKIIFLRHGQSVWNEASLFTGWADVQLTTLGKNEAAAGATSMWKEGIVVDVAFTSLQSHVLKFLNDKSDSATRAARGREWVRGWNDSSGGNQ